MSGEITARQLALANFWLCQRQKHQTGISKASTLHFIAGQLSGALSHKTAEYKAAFAAYWLYQQRPFVSKNLQTAVLVLAVLINQPNLNLVILADKLKTATSIAELEAKLSSAPV